MIISTSSLSGVILLLIVGLTLSFYIRKRQNTGRIGKYFNTLSLIKNFPHIYAASWLPLYSAKTKQVQGLQNLSPIKTIFHELTTGAPNPAENSKFQ